MGVMWDATWSFLNSSFGAAVLGAIVGAVVGGIATAVTACWVYRSEEQRRAHDESGELRRTLTVNPLRAMGDLRELRVAPERDQHRAGEVESTASSSLALLNANLELPREWGMKEWITRVYDGINEFNEPRLEHHVYQGYIAEQLLGWSVGDPALPVEWFEELCEVPLRDSSRPISPRGHSARTPFVVAGSGCSDSCCRRVAILCPHGRLFTSAASGAR